MLDKLLATEFTDTYKETYREHFLNEEMLVFTFLFLLGTILISSEGLW